MAQHTLRFSCNHHGCKEWSFTNYSSMKAYHEGRKRRNENPWKCIRHTNPESVLSLENTKIVETLISRKSEKHPHLKDLFWEGKGMESTFTYGYGWKAFTGDFPEGTKIKVTVELILPEEEEPENEKK